ncbi:MAG: DinB family protein [Thermoanaerobaculia bacterium]
MKRALVTAAVLGILLAGVASAQEARPMAKAGVKAEILRQIEDAEKKLVALAEAIPAEKYAWRPGEGVRSTGEVFAHVSGANYFLPTFWGAKMPEGIDPRSFEKDGADKAKTLATLKSSFEHARKAIGEIPEADLDKAVKLFGRDSNVREATLVVATHAHEHLGQAIAYARMNKVVPPWSRQEG